MTKYRNVSNPAALAVQIENDDEGTCQLIVLRGTEGVWFTFGHAGSGMSRVVNPERFGPTPKTYAELKRYAERFDANNTVEE